VCSRPPFRWENSEEINPNSTVVVLGVTPYNLVSRDRQELERRDQGADGGSGSILLLVVIATVGVPAATGRDPKAAAIRFSGCSTGVRGWQVMRA
jgi:hypothetical protein